MDGSQTVDLAEMVSRTADGAVAIGPDGRIALWNDAAAALLGHARPEVLGRLCWEVLAGRDQGGAPFCRQECPVLRRAASSEPLARFQMRSRTRAGRPVLLDVSSLAGHAGRSARVLLTHLFRSVSTDGPAGERGPDRGRLTPRESEVLDLTREGRSIRAIARQLGVSPATVRNHTQNILRKLGVHSRLEAVAVAGRHHLVP